MKLTRRSFLQKLGIGAGAAIAAPLLPASTPTETAVEPEVSTTTASYVFSGDPVNAVYRWYAAGERIERGSLVYLGGDGKAYTTGTLPIGVALSNAEEGKPATLMINGMWPPT